MASAQSWYDHLTVEPKWQKVWEEMALFQRTEKRQAAASELDPLYLLFAFAYPSGSGLHVGHVESMTALDILARYYRMQGKDVFFPVGWDAFGLPAENYAIKTGIPPAETTKSAINTFRQQIKRLAISYDWANEIATNHPGYYQWTQWLFLELFKKGLAYQDVAMVNWCPSCQTVLANEQVVNGLCERCDSEVIQKEMKQWFFKITEYKDELIEGLDQVDWPAATKQQQLNWIGKKEGVVVEFPVVGTELAVDCFTTRLDTIFGATFLVISPEKFLKLGLMDLLSPETAGEVQQYLEAAFKKTEEQRQIGEKDKPGVKTGLLAVNPVNGEKIPVFVADYVLGGYGTGAIMAVPAHDERDWAFAQKHGLPVVEVIQPGNGGGVDASVAAEAGERGERGEIFTDYGVLIASGVYSGLTSQTAIERILADFPDQTHPETNYRLRDWLISRQRYWGAPIPIVYDPEGQPHPVKEEHLPWILPTDVDFQPTGESPLKSSEEFIRRTEELYGEGWRPEFDTMDTFVDSSWYFLRYVDSRNENELAAREQLEKWLPVDLYMIGPEHIVLHLLYARFLTKFLRDQGYLNFAEPFQKMRHQGIILGPDGHRMSKSRGNVINPDDVVTKFGADTLRLYEMFMGPLEADKPWNVDAIVGVHKFLQRVNRLCLGAGEVTEAKTAKAAGSKVDSEAAVRKLHQTIRKVGHDIPALKFNTAIAAMMEFINTWEEAVKVDGGLNKEQALLFVRILAPLAPFMAEELYHQLTGSVETDSVHLQEWPVFDAALAREEAVEIGVQVNGKVRGSVMVPADSLEDEAVVLAAARAEATVARHLADKTEIKAIYVPGRIVNFVVAG